MKPALSPADRALAAQFDPSLECTVSHGCGPDDRSVADLDADLPELTEAELVAMDLAVMREKQTGMGAWSRGMDAQIQRAHATKDLLGGYGR